MLCQVVNLLIKNLNALFGTAMIQVVLMCVVFGVFKCHKWVYFITIVRKLLRRDLRHFEHQ